MHPFLMRACTMECAPHYAWPLHLRLNLIESYQGARMSAKITHSEVLRRLRALKAELQDVPYLNHGGCGVVAGVVGRSLEKLGIPVEVVTHRVGRYDEWGYSGKIPADVREILQDNGVQPARASTWEWDSHGLSRTHLAVRFESNGRLYTWDSSGLRRGGKSFGRWHSAEYAFGMGLTVRECNNMARSGDGWNMRFDRRNVRTVREAANRHLLRRAA